MNDKIIDNTKIVITRITLIDASDEKITSNARVVLDKKDLETYRNNLTRNGDNVVRVLFNYEMIDNSIETYE